MQATVKKNLKRALFLFRRDMRLDDNTGLLYALKNSDEVYPIFIFDKKQVDPEKNKYFGSNCVQFMCESLEDLDRQLKKKGSPGITLYHGTYPDIINKIIEEVKPSLLCLNCDYTTYSQERDKLIEESCKKHNVEFQSFEDICLLTKEQATSGFEGAKFYKKYTPFYNKAIQYKVRVPEECKLTNFSKESIDIEGCTIKDFGKQFYKFNEHLEVRGGRDNGLKILSEQIPKMKDYEVIRNQPSLKTSQLSAHNKFGTVSIREVLYTAKSVLKDKAEVFIRQLYWRDFYYYIAQYYPHVFSGPMKLSYLEIPWENDQEKIEAWQQGRTGCPIVDAAMR